MKTISKLLKIFIIPIFFLSFTITGCEKSECAAPASVAAPLVPGGAVVSASKIQGNTSDVPKVRHDTAKNSISNIR